MEFLDFCMQDPTYRDLDGTLAAKSTQLSEIFNKEKAEDGSLKMTDKAVIEDVRARNTELKDLGEKIEGRKSILKVQFDNNQRLSDGMKTVNGLSASGGDASPFKSLGEMLVEHDAYKSVREWHGAPSLSIALDAFKTARSFKSLGMKANDITTSQAPVFQQQLPGIVPYAQWPAMLMDRLPTFEATSGVVSYFRETARTAGAAPTAEDTTLPQSDFTLTRVDDTARVIGTYFKLTEQEIADRAYIIEFMNTKAQLELRIAGEKQILTGDGSGQNLNGIYTQATGSYAKGTYADTNGNPENDADALLHAIRDCRINGVCRPNLIALHPNQWTPIRMMKNAIGDYIWGAPSLVIDMSIWGVPAVETMYAVDGQALLGDFAAYYAFGINNGITLNIEKVGNDAINLARTLYIWMRGVNQVRRPRAFEIVTGLSSQV